MYGAGDRGVLAPRAWFGDVNVIDYDNWISRGR